MPDLKGANIKRAIVDRRSPVNRRTLDMGPVYPKSQDRKSFKERRSGWEERCDWERISKWSSSPIYTELP